MQSPPLTIPYLHRVARGLVPGAFFFDKFGITTQANNVAFHDVWQYGSTVLGNTNYIYPLDGTAPINRMSSSDNSDTQPVVMYGLDIDGEWTEQLVTLTGQTPVVLGTPLWRCFTAFNADSTTSPIVGNGFAGNIHWYNDAAAITDGVPDVASDTKCFISNGFNRTLQSFWTSPAGYNSYLLFVRVSTATRISAFAEIELYFRPFSGYPLIVDKAAFGTTGTSAFAQTNVDPALIEEKTDYIPRISVDTNDTTVSMISVFLLVQHGYERHT